MRRLSPSSSLSSSLARSFLVLACSLGLGLAAACAPGSDEEADSEGSAASTEEADLRPELAQMNDVSVLLPLAKNQAEIAGYLTPASKGRGGDLLPKTIYEKAVGFPGTLQHGGTPAAPGIAGLRLVAIRFDPCFGPVGESPAESACENQLRLIFQPVKVEGGKVVAEDTAVHAFYALTRAELGAALEKMIAIRRAKTDGRLGALAPHPLVKAEGLTGPTAKAIHALVLEYAGAKNLTRFTQFTTSGLGAAWNFSGFDIANGAHAAMKIPNIPASSPVVAFFVGFEEGELTGEPPFSPASSAKAEDNMQLLGHGAKAKRAEAEKAQLAFDAAVRLENPVLHSPDTTDCASCHAAEIARSMVGERKLGLRVKNPKNAFTTPARFVPSEDMKRTSVDASIDVHMFSYKGAVASIHQRTINESAAVVAYVNAKVIGAARR